MWETNPTAEFRPELFPLTLQLSANLMRNTNQGTLTAEAEIVHRGRTTLVVDVRVWDEQQKLIAKVTAGGGGPRCNDKSMASISHV